MREHDLVLARAYLKAYRQPSNGKAGRQLLDAERYN